jgi:hypothetical protein
MEWKLVGRSCRVGVANKGQKGDKGQGVRLRLRATCGVVHTQSLYQLQVVDGPEAPIRHLQSPAHPHPWWKHAPCPCAPPSCPPVWLGVLHPILQGCFSRGKGSAMAKKYRSPGMGEGGDTEFEPVRSWGPPLWTPVAVALLALVPQAGCATGTPLGGQMMGSSFRYRSLTPPEGPDAKRRAEARVAAAAMGDAHSEEHAAAGGDTEESRGFVARAVSTAADDGASAQPRRQARRAGKVEQAEEVESGGVGWPDGVGDGRPYEVPITLDYFQGFLVQAGVPTTAVPDDGRTLSPQQAMELLPHLLSTPVTLGNFGPRRMAAHLLLEVATGGVPVSRDELHARMRRFVELLVLRPDGYLVKPTTGVAVQKAGAVVLAEDGTLRAGRFEVGPFYAIDGGRLFPVDEKLKVPKGARPAGLYTPDKNVPLAVAEGAVLAVVDMVEGLYRLVFYTGETLESLAELPGAVRVMYENAPQLWEEFRHKPYAERVRTVSRLATGAVLTVVAAHAC